MEEVIKSNSQSWRFNRFDRPFPMALDTITALLSNPLGACYIRCQGVGCYKRREQASGADSTNWADDPIAP
jgi:hypothetical protein